MGPALSRKIGARLWIAAAAAAAGQSAACRCRFTSPAAPPRACPSPPLLSWPLSSITRAPCPPDLPPHPTRTRRHQLQLPPAWARGHRQAAAGAGPGHGPHPVRLARRRARGGRGWRGRMLRGSRAAEAAVGEPERCRAAGACKAISGGGGGAVRSPCAALPLPPTPLTPPPRTPRAAADGAVGRPPSAGLRQRPRWPVHRGARRGGAHAVNPLDGAVNHRADPLFWLGGCARRAGVRALLQRALRGSAASTSAAARG